MAKKAAGSRLAAEEMRRRRLLFQTCRTQEELRDWQLAFFGLELPECTVDPDSDSSPAALEWEVYELALRGGSEEVSEIMGYASRDSYKTLVSAALEVLMVFHHHRDVVHLAAIESQSLRAQKYVRKFLERPTLRDFMVGEDNKRKLGVTWYQLGDTYLTAGEWKLLPGEERDRYQHHNYEIQVVVCTTSGVQGPHGEFMCVTGDTHVIVRDDSGTNRKRRTYRANGLYRMLAGLNPSGNWAPEEGLIRSPAVKMHALSMNFRTGEAEWKPITAAVCKRSEVLDIKTSNGEISVTADHPLWVIGKGFVAARSIVPGDRLVKLGKGQPWAGPLLEEVQGATIQDGDIWEQVVLGSLLGDGALHCRPGNNPNFYENHSQEQAEYLAWKKSILLQRVNVVDTSPVSGYTQQPLVGIKTGNSALFKPFTQVRSELEGVDKLTPLGLAIWYMDDGCAGNVFRLSTECFTKEQNEKLADKLATLFDIHVVVGSYERDNKTYYYLRGGVAEKRRLNELCGKHIHPSMAYKFDTSSNWRPCVVCARPFWFIDAGTAAITCQQGFCRAIHAGSLLTAEVQSVVPAGRQWVFDFTVADNHNFWANSFFSRNCVDEVDVIPNPSAYQDAKMIPGERTDRKQLPITLKISTRKSAFGLVQQEIDQAHKTKMVVRHWNVLDVTQPCPPTRHRPDLPRLPIYVDPKELEAIDQAGYDTTPDDRKGRFQKLEGYGGCLKNCQMFAACRGHLATRQLSTAATLKSVSATQLAFKRLGGSPDVASAQLLSRKPSSEGLIYPRIDADVHVLAAEELLWLIAERRVEGATPQQLADILIGELGGEWVGGIDFGYTHNFSVSELLVVKPWAIVFDFFESAGLELEQQIALCEERGVLARNPRIYPDMAYPGSIAAFSRRKFKMVRWKKGPGSVADGIQITRGKLRPTMGQPELLFLRQSPGAMRLMELLSKYHFTKDAQGNWTDVPSEDGDDGPDSLRYAVQNTFPSQASGVIVASASPPVAVGAHGSDDIQQQWFSQMMQHVGGSYDQLRLDQGVRMVKKGRAVILS